jgi:uncharacterized membrane protein
VKLTPKKLFRDHFYPTVFFLILLTGTGLRLYRLGAVSLWFDEIGVALAAMEETLAGAVAIARSHAAAMPLDYVVAWLTARVLGSSEWALRLPAALWSSFALIPMYFLFKEFTSKPTALLAMLFTAISPIAIQFAQELRFYSALLFFYYLSSLLMVIAVKKPTWKNFILFGLVTIIGIYFHIYVSLAICNGLFYLYIQRKTDQIGKIVKNMVLTLIIIGIFALPGYLYFCSGESAYQYNLDLSLIPFYILQGVGLIPYYSLPNMSGWIFFAILIIMAIIGSYAALKKSDPILKTMVVSAFFQILLIVIADSATGYFFAARQILFLLPITSLMVAVAIKEISGTHETFFLSVIEEKKKYAQIRQGIAVLIITSLMIFSFPANGNTFHIEKSQAREVSAILVQEFLPGDSILVIPAWNAPSIEYYLNHRFDRPDIANAVKGISTQDLYKMNELSDQVYLIINANDMIVDPDWLEAMAFEQRSVGEHLAYSAEFLFTRH